MAIWDESWTFGPPLTQMLICENKINAEDKNRLKLS